MNREELQQYAPKTASKATIEDCDAVSPIYCLLNFDKRDFCMLIDAIGLDKWTAAAARWERLNRAEQELTARENYERNILRLEVIELEQEELKKKIETYKKAIRF